MVEVMETLCDSMSHYAETTNELGKKSLVRTITYSGEALSLDNFKIDSDIVHNLKTVVSKPGSIFLISIYLHSYSVQRIKCEFQKVNLHIFFNRFVHFIK